MTSSDCFALDTSRLTAHQPASRLERLLARTATDSKRPNSEACNQPKRTGFSCVSGGYSAILSSKASGGTPNAAAIRRSADRLASCITAGIAQRFVYLPMKSEKNNRAVSAR